MKQQFDQVDTSRSHGGKRSDKGVTPTHHHPHAEQPVATPVTTSETWLSEALKHWCTDPHAPH
jgi:hypothetical protein